MGHNFKQVKVHPYKDKKVDDAEMAVIRHKDQRVKKTKKTTEGQTSQSVSTCLYRMINLIIL